MAAGWFFARYRRQVGADRPTVYCPVQDYMSLILADGGAAKWIEILGGRAVGKVRASVSTLLTIAADPDVFRLPKDIFTDTLASLTNNQKSAIVNELQVMGYTLAEIQEHFPLNDLGSYTFRDLLCFAARRRRIPRYDVNTDSFIYDGELRECLAVETLELGVAS